MSNQQSKTIGQRLAAAGTVAAVGLGAVAAAVGLAGPAQAASYSAWDNCRWVGNAYVCERWVNYNWFEELVGKRDFRQYKTFMYR